jgi:hypothetical protein
MQTSRKTAAVLLGAASFAAAALAPSAWSQQPSVVVQVPSASPDASAQPATKGSTFFQTAGAVSLENGEGAITATLGDLLRETDAAGLERVRITGRARSVSGAGTNIGQVT